MRGMSLEYLKASERKEGQTEGKSPGNAGVSHHAGATARHSKQDWIIAQR